MTNKHPRLRHHTRKRANGKVVVYYFYDMRGLGEADVPLGSDHAEAIKKWDELHNRKPRIAGTIEQAFAEWEKERLPKYENKGTRDMYTRNLRHIRPVFGPATWDSVTLPHLKAYLDRRTAKTIGNREMALLSIVWNYARLKGFTALPWPAAGMERSGWKNPENARRFEVTDALFDAVYAKADPLLRSCMDIATATGLRLTDVRTIAMPHNGMLRFQANKTDKPAYFEVASSPVLSAVLERRQAIKASHVMFLSDENGRPVSESKLRGRYDKARIAAAQEADKAGDTDLAQSIRAMFLRDMRKRASDIAGTDEEASKLLQHSSVSITKKHYRSKPSKLQAVR